MWQKADNAETPQSKERRWATRCMSGPNRVGRRRDQAVIVRPDKGLGAAQVADHQFFRVPGVRCTERRRNADADAHLLNDAELVRVANVGLAELRPAEQFRLLSRHEER